MALKKYSHLYEKTFISLTYFLAGCSIVCLDGMLDIWEICPGICGKGHAVWHKGKVGNSGNLGGQCR